MPKQMLIVVIALQLVLFVLLIAAAVAINKGAGRGRAVEGGVVFRGAGTLYGFTVSGPLAQLMVSDNMITLSVAGARRMAAHHVGEVSIPSTAPILVKRRRWSVRFEFPSEERTSFISFHGDDVEAALRSAGYSVCHKT